MGRDMVDCCRDEDVQCRSGHVVLRTNYTLVVVVQCCVVVFSVHCDIANCVRSLLRTEGLYINHGCCGGIEIVWKILVEAC